MWCSAAGHYSPGMNDSKCLMAHELTHVVQQTQPGQAGYRSDENSVEQEAEAISLDVISGGSRVDVRGAEPAALARAPAPEDEYPAPTPEVLQVMYQMQQELADLRAGAPPSRSPQEEAQRTFCIVTVVAPDGTVTQSSSGAYLRGGPHAEELALGMIDLASIAPTETLLLVVDQFPCEERCAGVIREVSTQIPGGLRVLATVVEWEGTGQLAGLPKTAATKPLRPGQVWTLYDWDEFRKIPTVKPPGEPGEPLVGTPTAPVTAPGVQPALGEPPVGVVPAPAPGAQPLVSERLAEPIPTGGVSARRHRRRLPTLRHPPARCGHDWGPAPWTQAPWRPVCWPRPFRTRRLNI